MRSGSSVGFALMSSSLCIRLKVCSMMLAEKIRALAAPVPWANWSTVRFPWSHLPFAILCWDGVVPAGRWMGGTLGAARGSGPLEPEAAEPQ